MTLGHLSALVLVGLGYRISIECPTCWVELREEGTGDPPPVLAFSCPYCGTVVEVEQ